MTQENNDGGQRGRMRKKTPDVDDDNGQQGGEDNKGGQRHSNQKEVADNEG